MMWGFGLAKKLAHQAGNTEIVLARDGVVTEMRVPVVYRDRTLTDIDLNAEQRRIEVSGVANAVYVATDEVGFMVGAEFTPSVSLFFLSEELSGVVLEVKTGWIVLRDVSGKAYSVDSSGHITYLNGNQRVVWRTASELLESLTQVVKYKYGVDNKLSRVYVHNLVVDARFEAIKQSGEGPTLASKFTSYYDYLALGKYPLAEVAESEGSQL